jgi:hypothetical protein
LASGPQLRLQRFKQRRLATSVRANNFSTPIFSPQFFDQLIGGVAEGKMKGNRAWSRPAGCKGVIVSRRSTKRRWPGNGRGSRKAHVEVGNYTASEVADRYKNHEPIRWETVRSNRPIQTT